MSKLNDLLNDPELTVQMVISQTGGLMDWKSKDDGPIEYCFQGTWREVQDLATYLDYLSKQVQQIAEENKRKQKQRAYTIETELIKLHIKVV